MGIRCHHLCAHGKVVDMHETSLKVFGHGAAAREQWPIAIHMAIGGRNDLETQLRRICEAVPIAVTSGATT